MNDFLLNVKKSNPYDSFEITIFEKALDFLLKGNEMMMTDKKQLKCISFKN